MLRGLPKASGAPCKRYQPLTCSFLWPPAVLLHLTLGSQVTYSPSISVPGALRTQARWGLAYGRAEPSSCVVSSGSASSLLPSANQRLTAAGAGQGENEGDLVLTLCLETGGPSSTPGSSAPSGSWLLLLWHTLPVPGSLVGGLNLYPGC